MWTFMSENSGEPAPRPVDQLDSETRRIMGRMLNTPPTPHKPVERVAKAKERPASKGRVRKSKV
jgi:hypothetical protein